MSAPSTDRDRCRYPTPFQSMAYQWRALRVVQPAGGKLGRIEAGTVLRSRRWLEETSEAAVLVWEITTPSPTN